MKVSRLTKNVLVEYVLIILALVVGYVLLPKWMEVWIGDNKGLDGLGNAMALVILVRIGRGILAFLFLLANPVRILIQFRKELKEMAPKLKRWGSRTLVAFPILVSLLILFSVPLSNLSFDMKYRWNSRSYSVKEEDYKTAEEFREELSQRGLLFGEDDEKLLQRLNEKYGYIPDRIKYYYYTEATMMALSNETFYDTIANKTIIDADSSLRAPYYVYNAILTKPSPGEKFQYAPIGRYDQQNYLSDNFCPFFEDSYVECKIMYVDGDLYAIIGVSEGYYIGKNFDIYDKPYYMILTEKDEITTYADGKYCPNGAIENEGWQFTMAPNTTAKFWVKYYPVRKVDRLDVDAINAVAEELQNGVLK